MGFGFCNGCVLWFGGLLVFDLGRVGVFGFWLAGLGLYLRALAFCYCCYSRFSDVSEGGLGVGFSCLDFVGCLALDFVDSGIFA